MKNLRRYQDLQKVDATTQTEVDIRELEEANSKRDLQLSEIALEQARVEDQQIAADAKALEAREEQQLSEIQQAESQRERAKTNLGYATILSPIDGVVLEHLVEPGQTVAASFQTPNLFRVATDLQHIRIDARLDEADIGRIRVGQAVQFDIDAYRNETFEGTVAIVRLAPENKANVVTYPVLVEASNPKVPIEPFASGRINPDVLKALGVTPVNHGWKLFPGMTASLRFTVETKKNALRLPGAALRFIPPANFGVQRKPVGHNDADKKKGTRGLVYVVGAMGALETRAVFVGETDGEFFEILNGDLKEGDAIVVGSK
jgi:HlyD family secretion protein